MHSVYYGGNENFSETDDKLSFLRRTTGTATRVCETPSTLSMDALCQSGGQSCTPEAPLSRSFLEAPGMFHGPLPNNISASKSTLTSTLHGRSNFVPMDPRSLVASIKREENWSRRSRSPSRKPRHLSIKFSSCDPSTTIDEAEGNKALSENEDSSFSCDFDELGVPDDGESKSFLLGVSTPTTLRRRKLQLSLQPVHESHDEAAKENPASNPHKN